MEDHLSSLKGTVYKLKSIHFSVPFFGESNHIGIFTMIYTMMSWIHIEFYCSILRLFSVSSKDVIDMIYILWACAFY